MYALRTKVVLLLSLGALLIGAGTAAAATAPAASTGPVTSVAPTTVTVSGSINPEGTATTWYVEYGTSTGYGTKTASTSAGAGTTSAAISASLTSLKAGTTYHYRVVATSAAGTTHGADGIVTTSSAPAAATGTAAGITATTAALTGTVDPSGRATTWYFEYGTSTNYGTKTAAKDAGAGIGAAAVSAPITGLTTGRTYHFRLVATSDAGTSRGSDHTFVASAAPTVSTKGVSNLRDTTATLNSSVDPNGQATTVYFDLGTSTSYGTKTPAASAGSGTSAKSMPANVSKLAGDTTYHFRVVATNASGTTVGADQTFTTTGQPITHTAAAIAVTPASATLSGTVDAGGHSTNWYFEYGTTASYGTKTATQNVGSSIGAKTVSIPVALLSQATTYHFRLVASNSSGTGYSADATFTTAGPPVTIVPSSATVIFGHSVTLRGIIASKQPSVSIGLFLARGAGTSFTSVATVLTGVGGTWTYTVKPPISTTYKVIYGGGSASTTVGVRPTVSLAALRNGAFKTHAAGRSLFGHVVQLQRRRANGSWITISRNRLNSSATATFHPKLPHGRSVLRVAFSAGAGYLAAYSTAHAVRR
jgi:hypothetical protein